MSQETMFGSWCKKIRHTYGVSINDFGADPDNNLDLTGVQDCLARAEVRSLLSTILVITVILNPQQQESAFPCQGQTSLSFVLMWLCLFIVFSPYSRHLYGFITCCAQ